jgi:hypothetical protein
MESSHPLRLPEMAERQMTIEGGSRLIEGHFETWFLRVFLVRLYALFVHVQNDLLCTFRMKAVCGV